jgi:Holliday junction resolvase RusA-like endonuclease
MGSPPLMATHRQWPSNRGHISRLRERGSPGGKMKNSASSERSLHLMAFPTDHPLARHLLPLSPDAPPGDRVQATLRAYNEAKAADLRLPLSKNDAKTVRDWLVWVELHEGYDETGHGRLLLFKHFPVIRCLIYPDAAAKANYLHQAACITCIPDPQRHPRRVSFSVRTRPFSAQSLPSENLRLIKQKVRSSMQQRFGDLEASWRDTDVCIRLIAVMGRDDAKEDADNIVKGLLDALQGSVYSNDAAICHLTIDRFRHEGNEGFYLASATPVKDPLSDVILPTVDVNWAGQAEIVIP